LEERNRRCGSAARGDRVAILCTKRIEFMQLFLGCARLGAIAVPINTASHGFQLHHILSNSGARLLRIESSLGSALATIDIDRLPLDRAKNQGLMLQKQLLYSL
jgi:carnitine-CoA ligase